MENIVVPPRPTKFFMNLISKIHKIPNLRNHMNSKPKSILDDQRWVTAFILIIKILVIIYDVITFPIYYFIQKPWIAIEKSLRLRAISKTAQPQGPYQHINTLSPLKMVIDDEIKTLYDLFRQLTRQFNKKNCFGTREILAEEDEVQSNGKVFKKFVMGNYKWRTYTEVKEKVDSFSRGLQQIGQYKERNVVLFAETREEWLIAALACFQLGIPVVTLYANLGEDAIIHGINETEVNLVITSHELLAKFKTILPKTPLVENLIYMEGLHDVRTDGFPSNVNIQSFNQVEEAGRKSTDNNQPIKMTQDDTAIIMYTSGSTGLPKGVIITHGNILAAISSFGAFIKANTDDIFLAYLPLAHVLELMLEFLCLLMGVPIGYSSPLTLTDRSSKVKKGCKGDATLLKPTILGSVPLILDRIYKTILETVHQGNLFSQQLFQAAYDYKLFYIQHGFSTPILDLVVFQKIRNLLGGNVRMLVTGGAPLSPDTHDFIKVCLCVPLQQGYGLTETCACATVTDEDDLNTGRVGQPMYCCNIALENWEEGSYRTSDRPFPRGELLIGGKNVTKGYYKNPEKTAEEYFEKDGMRWFRTGDIGEIQADGCIKIIDRKKDLVKLQGGEYLSLGKVESELKMISLVDNICVYGDGMKDFSVAIISPNPSKLQKLGAQLGRYLSFEELCKDPDVEKAVTKMVIEHAKKSKLEKFEIPLRVRLVTETWHPDSGLVTAAFKLKRKNIQDFYQPLINEMYSS